MNDEKSDQMSTTNQVEKTAQCEPGCNCGKTSLGAKGKMIICLVVVIAATAVLGRSFARKAVNETFQGQKAYATTAPVFPSPASTAAMETNLSKSSLWGEPLKDMASLNQVAAQKNAIFMYLFEKGRGADEAVKRQIEQAAGKAQFGGMKMALYTLDASSKDYAKITSQVPAPCVLAMVKGGGISVVSGEITEGKLLQAIVAASRPSGCGPGCAPSGCK
jgi:hypothetical protein